MKYFLRIIYPILLSAFAFTYQACSQDDYEFRNVATGLRTPWEILWGPDDYIWATEREGKILRINPESGEKQLLITIPEVFMRDNSGDAGERGLMGLVLHPQFDENPFVYTVYTYGNSGNTKVKVVRYKYNGTELIEPLTLLENIKGAWNHDGSRLWIAEDMTMYVTTGDANDTGLPQNLQSLNGKILRMELDGTIPEDNPFPGSYIYSWGHRNPQGLVMHKGIIYSSEHGPDTDDELNLILKGRNYGWPRVNGYCDKPSETQFCKDSNVVEAMLSLYPGNTAAVAGIDYYDHDRIPDFKNSILITTLKTRKLIQAKLNDDGTKVISNQDYFTNRFGRLRDICISPDGRLFISTSNYDGRGNPGPDDDRIIEIIPKKTSAIEPNTGSLKYQAKPNPASDEITIEGINAATTEISIYDSLGRLVNHLAFDTEQSIESISWNCKDYKGNKCSPGYYFARISENENIFSILLLIAK